MLPGHIASMYKLPESQKQLAKLDITSLLGCKESLQLLFELLGCTADNHTLNCKASIAQAGSCVAADAIIQNKIQLLQYCQQLCCLQISICLDIQSC